MRTFVSNQHRLNISLLVILLGTLYIYSHSLIGPFIWDNEHFVLRNPAIRDINNTPEYFSDPGTSSGGDDFSFYRPIRDISYMIDYLLFGLNPFGFRMINLLLHFQNIFMVALLVRLLTGDLFISVIASSLFAFHPVQTEAVSWVKGRDDLICAFFYLSSLVLYIKGREGRRFLVALSIASFALALLAKETAITLPAMIFMYDIFFPQRKSSKGSYHPFLYTLLIYFLVRTIVLDDLAQTDFWGLGFISAFYTNLTGMVYYLKLLFFPVNLCADYLMFPIRTTILDKYVIGALVVILSFMMIAIYNFFKGSKFLAFSILWFFVALLPVSNIIPIRINIAERFLYLPSVGIFIGCAILLSSAIEYLEIKKLKKISISLFLFVPVALGLMTVDRNHVWTDEHLLWSDVLDKSPGNPRAHHNLASEYRKRGMQKEALSHYKLSLMMPYHSSETHLEMGRLLSEFGDEENAMLQLFEALKDNPANADINYEIGKLMSKKGWYSEAMLQYRDALSNNPDHMDALYDLGVLYMRQKDYPLASIQFRKLLVLSPVNKMAQGFLEHCEASAKKREGIVNR